MNEYIDVDKLHEVLEGRLVGRSTGQTFSRLVQMVQSIEFLPNGCVVHISASEQEAKMAVRNFMTIMGYLGMGDLIEYQNVGKLRFDNGCIALFLSAASEQKIERFLAGVKLDNYFVDHFAEYLINDQLHDFLQTRLRNG